MFPAFQRVSYEKAPLRQVVCQLRFPAILRIESQPPADFQDQIRDIFPFVERAAPGMIAQLPQEIVQVVAGGFAGGNYVFRTETGDEQIALAQDSMSLTVSNYSRWEDFRRLLTPAVQALIDVYKPAHFVRAGLRYINALSRSTLGLSDKPWGYLLRPEVAGELSLPEWASGVEDARRIVRCRLPDHGDHLLFQHGMGQIDGQPEPIYLLDFDFYSDEKIEVHDAAATVDRLYGYTGNAFRWAISDAAYAALGPQVL